jgi:hypothetical protein
MVASCWSSSGDVESGCCYFYTRAHTLHKKKKKNKKKKIAPVIRMVVVTRRSLQGKFSCPFCGPKMKYCWSKFLGKEVFDEYRNFLSKKNKYHTTEKYMFNGKQETGL